MATDDTNKCECGCGGDLPKDWKPPVKHRNRKPPRFISGHNCRVMKTKRPDPPPPNVGGFCMCQCGKPVPRALKTGRGNVKGEFLRYLQGHAPEIGRLAADDPRGPNPSGKCCCGCQGAVGIADRTDPIKQTISGCYVRYIRGHDKWKSRPDVSARTGICECGCGEETPIAKRSARGNVVGQPMRYVDQRHAQRGTYTVDPASGCWLMHPDVIDGYSRVHRDGESKLAHVWHWEQANGPVPDGLELDHLCRTPNCVRPSHLEAVTHGENMRRAFAARRMNQSPKIY